MQLTQTMIEQALGQFLKPHITLKSIVASSRTTTFAKVRLSGVEGDAPKTAQFKLEGDTLYCQWASVSCGLDTRTLECLTDALAIGATAKLLDRGLTITRRFSNWFVEGTLSDGRIARVLLVARGRIHVSAGHEIGNLVAFAPVNAEDVE